MNDPKEMDELDMYQNQLANLEFELEALIESRNLEGFELIYGGYVNRYYTQKLESNFESLERIEE